MGAKIKDIVNSFIVLVLFDIWKCEMAKKSPRREF
jgi:hypothetical protein